MPTTQARFIKSYLAKPGEIEPKWWLVDASGKVVGKLATEIAMMLMGKHRPTYTPHVVSGDCVVVVNAAQVALTGKKWDQKEYTHYTGYTRLRRETAGQRRDRKPELLIREAVRRMLPKNKLAVKMLQNLKVYAGTEHPHQAQNPQPKEIAARKPKKAKATA